MAIPVTARSGAKSRALHLRLVLLIAAGGVVLVLVPNHMRTVASPLIAGMVIAIGFMAVLSRRSQYPPVADIGTWFVGTITVYLVVPLSIFLFVGQEYTAFNDNRLVVIHPSPTQVAEIGWLYVAFLCPFAVVYLAVRGYAEPARVGLAVVKGKTLGVMIALWVALQLLNYVFVPALGGGSYESGFLEVGALPLPIRQVLKISQAWNFVLTLGLRVWLFQDFARKKWIILAWVLYDVALAVIAPGTRTGVVLSLAATFLLFHLFVRPIRLRAAILTGVFGLLGFLLLGFLRSTQNLGTISTAQTGGEFEVLFANAVDLQHRIGSGEIGRLPLSLHLADLIAAIPSQLLPFVKQDPAVWYMATFYPLHAEQGSGVAFGVISQGIIGFGWVELVVRGSILGFAFAAIHRYFVRNRGHFWAVVLYVWASVWVYQSFRNQSFILFASMIQEFIPLVLVVEGLRRLLSRKRAVASPVPGPMTGSEATS